MIVSFGNGVAELLIQAKSFLSAVPRLARRPLPRVLVSRVPSVVMPPVQTQDR